MLEDRVKPLVNAAIEYMTRNTDCTFRKVYFLTYTDQEFEVCRAILETDSRLEPLQVVQPAEQEFAADTQVTDGATPRRPAARGVRGAAPPGESVRAGIGSNAHAH